MDVRNISNTTALHAGWSSTFKIKKSIQQAIVNVGYFYCHLLHIIQSKTNPHTFCRVFCFFLAIALSLPRKSGLLIILDFIYNDGLWLHINTNFKAFLHVFLSVQTIVTIIKYVPTRGLSINIVKITWKFISEKIRDFTLDWRDWRDWPRDIQTTSRHYKVQVDSPATPTQ